MMRLNAGLLPSDLMSRAAGLQDAVKRNPRLPKAKHKQETIERYERIRAVIEPLIHAGARQWDIANALTGLGIKTPTGRGYWTQCGVRRALEVLNLKTKAQVNLGVA